LTTAVPRLLALALLLTFSFGISVGDEKARLTIINLTDHYLHAIVDGHPHLYISPGSSATHEADGASEFFVNVFYAPGQNMSGSREETVFVAPYNPGGWGCNSNLQCTNTAPMGGHRSWEVAPDSLQ
jgi:hypothetical protein